MDSISFPLAHHCVSFSMNLYYLFDYSFNDMNLLLLTSVEMSCRCRNGLGKFICGFGFDCGTSFKVGKGLVFDGMAWMKKARVENNAWVSLYANDFDLRKRLLCVCLKLKLVE